MTKRGFDILISLIGIIIFSPLFLILSIFVFFNDYGSIIFAQSRVGFQGRLFRFYKFRTMSVSKLAENGQFDAGNISRVTRIGKYLRKTKLDELPQLFNVLKGDMSIVGPRPEVKQYIEIYPERWAFVYKVKPGITDNASIEFRNEERAVVRVDYPTNLPKARSVGYKAKQGIFVVRVRVRKGTGTHHRPKNKRRPKRQGQSKLSRRISTQGMAEQKASKYHENAEALGSYKIAEDGKWHYFEVVLADRTNPSVLADKNLKYLAQGHQGRAERGKTYATGANKITNLKNKKKIRAKKALERRFG